MPPIKWLKNTTGTVATAFIGPSEKEHDYVFVLEIHQRDNGFHAYAWARTAFFYQWYPRTANPKIIVHDLKEACIKAALQVLAHLQEE